MTIGFSSMPCFGRLAPERHGATCRTSLANGTASSHASVGGPRRAFGRVFSTRGRCKRGSEDQEIGRSRGGPTTKISVSVDGLGNPVRFILTAGNVNDIVQAEELIRGLSFDKLLADKGYDSDRFRASIAQVGARSEERR